VGRTYTIGFWALQHGSHPFEGKLETIGIRLVGDNGTRLTFDATPLPEPAHYATTIHVATSGAYAVFGYHKPFGDYRIGTLTVPGALTVLGIPQPLPIDKAQLPWGEIRPPTVPVDAGRSPFEDGAAVPAQQPADEAAKAARPTSDEGSPAPTLLAILAATALLLGLFFVHRRRRAPTPVAATDRLDMRVGTPEEPVDAGPGPVEISSRT
jgi:MYXO-CTERM domain-containing protein